MIKDSRREYDERQPIVTNRVIVSKRLIERYKIGKCNFNIVCKV